MSMTPDERGPEAAALLPSPQPDAPELNPAQILRKRVYIGFAGIVAVGLAFSGLYIGGRLFAKPTQGHEMLAAQKVVQSVAPAPRQSPLDVPPQGVANLNPAAALAPAPPPAVVNNPSRALWKMITPKAGEKYLQLAALGMSSTDRYIAELETKGIHASVAPGPTGDVYRVVLGPFADRSALERQRDVLEAADIQSMLRLY